jgi:uncharacterized protein YbjT (DUF2867 family)
VVDRIGQVRGPAASVVGMDLKLSRPVLVTGGTGTLGRLVVTRLRDAGCEVRVLTRHLRSGPLEGDDGIRYLTGDLLKDQGIGAAVDGVRAIVHCASGLRGDAEATRNLVRAAFASGEGPHLVYISIVGVDRVPFGYYRSKLASEGVVADSGLPWTTLRATQFYDLVLAGVRKVAMLPVVPVPAGFRVQPIDADEVAARLVELTVGEPAGRVADLGGPQVASADELIRAHLTARHRRRPIVALPFPGTRRIRAGGLLVQERHQQPAPAPDRRTWEQFLADRLS